LNGLAGRAAIVTGSSRGIGRAIAIAMAAEGAAVAVTARTERVWDERLPGTIDETVAEIEAAGGRAIAIRADLSDEADRVRLVAEARAALGPITILVNNAAFTVPGTPSRPRPAQAAPSASAAPAEKPSWPSVATTPLRAYRRHFEMLFAAYELMQFVMPDMRQAGGGHIVNITSGASRMPGEGPYPPRAPKILGGYGGSKAALEHLTLTAAYEAVDPPIAVNALAPSTAIPTPGSNYYSREWGEYDSDANFAEAVVRLAQVDPQQVNGRILGHRDVLDGSFRSYVFGLLDSFHNSNAPVGG